MSLFSRNCDSHRNVVLEREGHGAAALYADLCGARQSAFRSRLNSS
jgi:hypothetical protein